MTAEEVLKKHVNFWNHEGEVVIDGIETITPQAAIYKAMTEYSNLVSKEKDEQLAELREKVNTLTIDNMAHEYNQAEAERFAPEYKRQIEEPLLEQLEALRERVKKLEEELRGFI